jgi:hypothetical protein
MEPETTGRASLWLCYLSPFPLIIYIRVKYCASEKDTGQTQSPSNLRIEINLLNMEKGGQISRRGAVFSGCGKLILAPCSTNVNLFATATGELVGHLEGHAGEVCCVQLDPKESNTQVSGSSS